MRAFPKYLLVTSPDPFSLLHHHFLCQYRLSFQHLIWCCRPTMLTKQTWYQILPVVHCCACLVYAVVSNPCCTRSSHNEYTLLHIATFWPLCANMMSSIKPEARNIYHNAARAAPSHSCRNIHKKIDVQLQRYACSQRQTHTHTDTHPHRHAHHDTLLPYQRWSNNKALFCMLYVENRRQVDISL